MARWKTLNTNAMCVFLFIRKKNLFDIFLQTLQSYGISITEHFFFIAIYHRYYCTAFISLWVKVKLLLVSTKQLYSDINTTEWSVMILFESFCWSLSVGKWIANHSGRMDRLCIGWLISLWSVSWTQRWMREKYELLIFLPHLLIILLLL